MRIFSYKPNILTDTVLLVSCCFIYITLIYSPFLFAQYEHETNSSKFSEPVHVTIDELKKKYPPGQKEFLPSSIIFWDPDFSQYMIIVVKSQQKLHLYKIGDTIDLIKTYDCTTGQNRGEKRSTGDKKTPEGTYFFQRKYTRKKIPDIVNDKEAYRYGELVFTTDFPNELDRRRRVRGNGIWLHGTDEMNRQLKEFETRGCVVLSNEDITELSEYIKLQFTPFTIVSDFNYQTREDIIEQRNRILNTIVSWKNAWQKQNIDKYISIFDRTFYSKGMNRAAYKKYKSNLFGRKTPISIDFHSIMVFHHRDNLIAVIVQEYHSQTINDTGFKRVCFTSDGFDWKIISETFQTIKYQDE